jgi:arginine decarboxylase (EC 4.1.1.19)
VDVLDLLRSQNMLDCVQLLHFHLAPRFPNIRDIRTAVHEAARMYAELAKEGCAMGFLDLGGGLAVDYDGSHTNYASSRNYSLEEYCTDIVESVMATVDEHDLPHPHIITESGRATVAYYSVLLFNVLDVSRLETRTVPQALDEDDPEAIHNLLEGIPRCPSRTCRNATTTPSTTATRCASSSSRPVQPAAARHERHHLLGRDPQYRRQASGDEEPPSALKDVDLAWPASTIAT